MTIDELAARMDEKFAGVNSRFDNLEQKVEEGFDASRARDENLRDLTKFGLEARHALREEMHRHIVQADRKNDEQIGLLKDVVQNLASRK